MKIKKKHLYIGAVVVVVLVICILVIFLIPKSEIYKNEGKTFSYASNRPLPKYTIELINKSDEFNEYHVAFQTRNLLKYEVVLHGLFFKPNSEIKGAVMLLPGGGVTKESEAWVARKLASWGYATLTIDQRGIGETGGYYLSLEDDYKLYLEGTEPVQHLSVYDALTGFDVLRSIEGVPKDKVVIAGESMGGRFILVAGAMEKRAKAVVAISTAGFHINDDNTPQNNFLLSIDPDQYVNRINVPILFLHGTNDTTVPIEGARYTFDLANEPKEFFAANGCGHGYCEKMDEKLKEFLDKIIS